VPESGNWHGGTFTHWTMALSAATHALDRLQRIASRLQELGYYTYIIKDQPDKPGEGLVQKVLRYALSSKFVLIENSEPSGHLYEIPHVAKAAECVTVVLQEEGKGATWMFEVG